VQRLGRKVSAPGATLDDWRIAGELALRLGDDFDLEFVDEVTDEIARVAPAHLGASAALLRRSRDGVVLPLRDHLDEIMVRTRDLNIMSEDGHAVSWDPIRSEAAVPAGSTQAVEGSGAGGNVNITPETGDPFDDPEAAAHAVDEARDQSERGRREAPPLHEWDRQAASTHVPGRDSYALRLVVQRTLYDGGRIVSCTPSLAALRKDPVLLVHAHDLANIGVDEGMDVRVTSSRATVTLPVRVDPSVPAGTARVQFTADGRGAAELIDTTAMVTDLRVETIRS
jgi:predicted molibdopterin-dependent oxidoreductase YjgC